MVAKLRRHGRAVAGVGAVATLVIGVAAWYLGGAVGVVLVVALWGPILAGLMLELGRLRHEQAEILARQDRAFTNLVAVLNPRLPLSATRGWAASPDLLCFLTRWILAERPVSVVELGSGTSTICMAYALERVGAGTLVAVDHDRNFADRTRAEVHAHGLSDRVRVVHAPLTELDQTAEAQAWYDLEQDVLPDRIDLLFIDGPPRRSGNWARYPALPVLRGRLGPESLVVLDDGFRRAEREIVERWTEEYRPARVELVDEMEKGAWLISGFGVP